MKRNVNYLDLIEEYSKTPGYSQFDKVLVLARRAKDLYAGKTCAISGLEGRKPTTKAQYEISNHLLEPVILDQNPEDVTNFDDFDEEDV